MKIPHLNMIAQWSLNKIAASLYKVRWIKMHHWNMIAQWSLSIIASSLYKVGWPRMQGSLTDNIFIWSATVKSTVSIKFQTIKFLFGWYFKSSGNCKVLDTHSVWLRFSWRKYNQNKTLQQKISAKLLYCTKQWLYKVGSPLRTVGYSTTFYNMILLYIIIQYTSM